jgi:hypothetical protein
MSEHGDDSTLYVELKAKIAQEMNHLVVAMILAFSAAGHLSRAHQPMDYFWSGLQLAAAAVLLILFIRNRRPGAVRAHTKVGWMEIACAVILAFEAWERSHVGRHHKSFMVIVYLPAVVTFLLGVFESKMSKRFFIRFDDRGIAARLGPFRRIHVDAADIRGVEYDGRNAFVLRKRGEPAKIAVWRLMNSKDVGEWLVNRARTLNIR